MLKVDAGSCVAWLTVLRRQVRRTQGGSGADLLMHPALTELFRARSTDAILGEWDMQNWS